MCLNSKCVPGQVATCLHFKKKLMYLSRTFIVKAEDLEKHWTCLYERKAEFHIYLMI